MIPYLHLFFAEKAHIFWNLLKLYLFCSKLISASEIIFYLWWTCFPENFGHKFTCSLILHLCYTHYVYTVPTMCTPYPLCVHRTHYMYTVPTMRTPYPLCVHRTHYVYTVPTMCTPYPLCVHRTHYVYTVPTMCTPYPLCVHRITKVDSILYQKFALWITIHSPFRHEVSLLHFSRNNYWEF